MRKVLLLIALLCIAFNGMAQPSDAYLLSRMNAGKMPGASFVIIKNGKWVWSKNLGKADIAAGKDVDDQTIFMMASVSKTMIVTSVMQLWEQGRINLDIDINHYLPFSVRTPSFPNDSISVRMLLTHTSAVKDEWNTMGSLYVYGDSPVSLDTLLKHYFTPGGLYYNASGNFYNAKPGAQYNYSNMGSTLAAYLVERITGDTYSHYCDTAIFQKICMDNTSLLLAGIQDTTKIARPYSWNGTAYEDMGLYGYPDYPDGQLRTNITALARFMTAFMNHGSYNNTQILSSATIDTILKTQTNVAGFQGLIFYAGISSNGDTLWGHSGGDAGVNTTMFFSRSNNTGVIIFTNGEGTVANNAESFADTLYKYGLTITPNANDTFPSCVITSINNVAYNESAVSIYPNPATDIIHIKSPVNGFAVITNIQGRMVGKYVLRKGDNKAELPSAAVSGLYVIHVKDDAGKLIKAQKLSIVR